MAERDRAVDAARVAAMFAVVLGHWVVTAPAFLPPDGSWRLASPLAFLSGGWVASHVLQVIPLFFIVGGFANTRAWEASEGGAWRFALRRWRRLAGPAFVLLGLLAAAGGVSVALGLAGLDQVLPATLLIVQPLWFLVVYVAVAALAPAAVAADRRLGWRAPALLLGAATLIDLGAATGQVAASVANVNVALVWLGAHQLGVILAHGRADRDRVLWLVVGSWAGMALLWWTLQYPLELVGVTGTDRSNMNPPSAMMVAHTLVQYGLFAWLRPRIGAWLRRSRRAWQAVRTAGSVVFAVFLLHQAALILVVAVTSRAGPLPGLTALPDSWGWVLARLAWFPVLAAVLAGLLAGFRRIAPTG